VRVFSKPARRRAAWLALLPCAVPAIAFAGLASNADASSGSFKPGLYVGKTSQGEPVKLKLTVGGPACEGKPCLFPPSDADQIYVAESCNVEGDTTNAYLDLFDETLPRSGVLHVDQQAFSKIVATIKVGHGGSLSGNLRATGTLEDGAKCDSGTVTFKAKLGGSTG
jgi:hypothetical protein